MVIVNNTGLTGNVQMWLCGGGSTAVIGNSSAVTTSNGTIINNNVIGGYTWSNNSGATQAITFAVIRTRLGN